MSSRARAWLDTIRCNGVRLTGVENFTAGTHSVYVREKATDASMTTLRKNLRTKVTVSLGTSCIAAYVYCAQVEAHLSCRLLLEIGSSVTAPTFTVHSWRHTYRVDWIWELALM